MVKERIISRFDLALYMKISMDLQWHGINRGLQLFLFQPCTWKFVWIYQWYGINGGL